MRAKSARPTTQDHGSSANLDLKKSWSVPNYAAIFPTGLAISGGLLYFGLPVPSDVKVLDGLNGGVVAIPVDLEEASHGKPAWTFQTGETVKGAPLVAEGVVYAASDEGHVYALDARSGSLRWKFYAGAKIDGSPVYADGLVYVVDDSGVIHALRAASGEEAWTFQVGSGEKASASVADGVVYVASWDHHVYAVEGSR